MNKSSAKAVSVSADTPYFKRPLAPAPKLVFVGVCLVDALLLVEASKVGNDWLAVFCAVFALVLAAVVLDFTGRRLAARKPNKLYSAEHLPQNFPRLKRALIALSLLALIIWVTANAQPGNDGSSLPYFLELGVIFLIIPQALAWLSLAKAKPQPKRKKAR